MFQINILANYCLTLANDFLSRHAIEISNRFTKNSNYLASYVARTSFELLIALGGFAWMCIHGIPQLADEESVLPCNIYGYMYECSGLPRQVVGVAYTKLVGTRTKSSKHSNLNISTVDD